MLYFYCYHGIYFILLCVLMCVKYMNVLLCRKRHKETNKLIDQCIAKVPITVDSKETKVWVSMSMWYIISLYFLVKWFEVRPTSENIVHAALWFVQSSRSINGVCNNMLSPFQPLFYTLLSSLFWAPLNLNYLVVVVFDLFKFYSYASRRAI